MSVIDKIQERLEKGYVGIDESVLMDDVSSLLILFSAKNRAIGERIAILESREFDMTTKDGAHDFNINSAIINELKNLIK